MARAAGFELMVDRKMKDRKNKYAKSSLNLKCRHSQIELTVESQESCSDQEQPSLKKRKMRNTYKASSKDMTCSFKLKIVCNPKDDLWYLYFRDLDEEEKALGLTCSSQKSPENGPFSHTHSYERTEELL